MSGVHDAIALQALGALPSAERRVFEPYRNALKKSSWYGDFFADRGMSAADKHKIDPEADRFIDPLSAVKFCGAFSHIIGDTGEPIHALPPAIVDRAVPPPPEMIGLELHSSIEKLKAPVRIPGYPPRVLGSSLPRAVMGTYAGLVELKQLGAAQAVPITQALYSGHRNKAVKLSQRAQNQSARLTADFMHTAFRLAREGEDEPLPLDLCAYPWVNCTVDMLYRYQPMVDVSLVPYSGGKRHPLSLRTGKQGKPKAVHGLGVIPYLGPPWVKAHCRETTIEYFLVRNAFETFQARVGANPLFRKSICDAVFRVLGDGKELYASPALGLNDSPLAVEADLKGVTWLTLSMRYTEASNATRADWDRLNAGFALHGVWAEPTLK